VKFAHILAQTRSKNGKKSNCFFICSSSSKIFFFQKNTKFGAEHTHLGEFRSKIDILSAPNL